MTDERQALREAVTNRPFVRFSSRTPMTDERQGLALLSVNWHPYPSDTMGPCPICGRSKVDAVHSSRRAPDERQAGLREDFARDLEHELLARTNLVLDADSAKALRDFILGAVAQVSVPEERLREALQAFFEVWDNEPPGNVASAVEELRAALAAQVPAQYGWHGNGDLCLGPECGVIDVDGDHPMADVHSNEWYDGYAAAQREVAIGGMPKPMPGWDHPVAGDGLSRWVTYSKCAYVSPEGRLCTVSELGHDGAWTLGHHFTTGQKS